jgi:hypothetical protein
LLPIVAIHVPGVQSDAAQVQSTALEHAAGRAAHEKVAAQPS